MTRSATVRLAAIALLWLSAVAHFADAGETRSGPASPAEAAAAVEAFDEALPRASTAEGVRLVEELARLRHKTVTERVHALSEDDAADAEVRVACFAALVALGEGEKRVGVRVGKWVEKASAERTKAWRKGEVGVPLDPRTGDAKTDTAEARAAIARGRAEARALGAALTCAARLGWRPRDVPEVMRVFVQSPFDELALPALATVAEWKCAECLPDLLRLFRMYPVEHRWETGSVVHAGGTNASAKAEWNTWFGHPLKQRARPHLVRALKAALAAITGAAEFPSPEALENWLDSPAGKRAGRR